MFLALLVLGAVAGTSGAAYGADRVNAGRVPPGTVVAGVDVGGMQPAQARAAVRTLLDRQLRRTLTIQAGTRSLRVPPSELGVHSHVAAAVRQAMAASQSTTWLSRSYHRLLSWSSGTSIGVRYSYPTAKIRLLIAHLAATIDRAARDASLQATANDTSVSFASARTGRSLDQRKALALVLGALKRHAGSVRLPVATTQPQVKNGRLGTTITVDLSTNTLRLYDGTTVIHSYPVATAVQPYSTPIGAWQVVGKDLHPVWINPGTAWAAGMPQTIPPGPANPLGLRALALNAPGILIHGTPEDASIGHWASHGCVRMHEADVLALYPLVPVGTKVIIYGAPPWGASAVAGSSTGF